MRMPNIFGGAAATTAESAAHQWKALASVRIFCFKSAKKGKKISERTYREARGELLASQNWHEESYESYLFSLCCLLLICCRCVHSHFIIFGVFFLQHRIPIRFHIHCESCDGKPPVLHIDRNGFVFSFRLNILVACIRRVRIVIVHLWFSFSLLTWKSCPAKSLVSMWQTYFFARMLSNDFKLILMIWWQL